MTDLFRIFRVFLVNSNQGDQMSRWKTQNFGRLTALSKLGIAQ
jgi:hypothetical protein